jgi:peptidyl-prolyl cis-trans isomerase D
MFEFVRTHTKLLQFLLVLLIFPSFIFFGIQGYSRFTEGGQATVAKVDGNAITQVEWDQAHQRQVEEMRRQRPGLDARLFDSPEFRASTLDELVRERVLLTAVNKLNLQVSSARVQQVFVEDPQFAALRNPDGSVNKDVLAAQGMSSANLEAKLRQDIAMHDVMRGPAATVVPSLSATVAFDAWLQQRDVSFARFALKDYASKAAPTDVDLQAYFKSHQAEFVAPEQASIEYALLDLESLKAGVKVSDDDLHKFYEENAPRYTSAEERRARHILIKVDGTSADDKQKAKARAEAMLAEVRKNPASFAELAKKNSADTVSAEHGGDLDFFGRAAMVKPFADAVFAMKPDEIGNLVETEFGFHIIQLTAVRGGERKPFDAVRAEIETELVRQAATKRWAESSEQFNNLVFEQADSLKPVFDKLQLQRRTASVGRKPVPGTPGALGSAKLLDAIFAGDSTQKKHNTEAIEVGSYQIAAARVLEYRPARNLTLDEVKDRVRQSVIAAQAAALARKDGEDMIAKLKQGGDAVLAGHAQVSRKGAEGLPASAIEAALKVDATKLPGYVGVVDAATQDYIVLRVEKVLARQPSAEDTKREALQYGQAWANAESRAYFDALKARFKTEVRAKPASESASAVER